MTKKSLNRRFIPLLVPKTQVRSVENTILLTKREKIYTALIRSGCLLFVLGMIHFHALAQKTITGCVVYEGNGSPRLYEPVYDQPTGMTTICNGYSVEVYSSSSTSGPINGSCRNGTISNAFPALRRDCVVGVKCGLVTTIDFVECSLDGYSSVLLALTAFPAFFAILGYRNRFHLTDSRFHIK